MPDCHRGDHPWRIQRGQDPSRRRASHHLCRRVPLLPQEAGADRAVLQGTLRVHQFTKVEMFVFCHPSGSEAMLERLIGIEEKIFQGLEIPYRNRGYVHGRPGRPRVPQVRYRGVDAREGAKRASGEKSRAPRTAPTTRRADWESASRKAGKNAFVHTLNGTALAVSRTLIALLENFQKEDGEHSSSRVRLRPTRGLPGITPRTSQSG